MNTVTDLTELSPRVVFDRAEIDRLRWFQIHRYFESGLLDALPECLPYDPYVDESTYFGLYTGTEIRATARIVHATSSLPVLEHHVLYPQDAAELQALHGTVAEISRLAVGRSTPHFRALALLSREFLRFGLLNQHATVLIASVEKPLIRILSRLLGVPLQIIGPTLEDYGTMNGESVPIKIDTIKCLNNFRTQQSRRWKFFMDGMVIDLTNDDSISTAIEPFDAVRVAS